MPEVYCNSIRTSWNHTSPHAFDLANNVHTWRIRISKFTAQLNDLLPHLNEAEKAKAFSYPAEKDKQRSIISRGILRLLMAKYAGRKPRDIKFEKGDNQKSFIATEGRPLHYNVSHSGDWILIAVANRPVGIDIERSAARFDYTDVLGSWFSEQEINFVKSADNAEATFYELWTRKEALTKATGKGVDDDLPLIPCLEGSHKTTPKIISSAENWIVSSFMIEEDYIGSIAYQPVIHNVCFWEISDLPNLEGRDKFNLASF